jgi:hypothetical protein
VNDLTVARARDVFAFAKTSSVDLTVSPAAQSYRPGTYIITREIKDVKWSKTPENSLCERIFGAEFLYFVFACFTYFEYAKNTVWKLFVAQS